jgi:phosphate transport system substrate-binding protein
VVLRGAGLDAASPIYEEVGSHLAEQGITLDYQLSTAGAAMAKFRAGRISFLSAAGTSVAGNLPRIGDTSALYVPVGFTAVSVIYHLPGVQRQLKLDGRALAGMFLGTVRTWNSRLIARENPGVRLPPTPVVVVHRGSAAQTTALLTGYLGAASKRWRRRIGVGASVHWTGGTSADTDSAVEAAVGSAAGAVGYIEQPQSLPPGIRPARLLDPSGDYTGPTMRATSAVGEATSGPDGFSLDTVNARAPGAYPIVSESYLLVYRDLCAAGLTLRQATAAQRFVSFVLGAGQSVVRLSALAPLPPGMRARARAAVRHLSCNAQPL